MGVADASQTSSSRECNLGSVGENIDPTRATIDYCRSTIVRCSIMSV